MKKSDELKNPTSCLNRADDSEPIFVLRANDEIAAGIVRTWAVLYIKEKEREQGNVTDSQQAKYDEAMALAAWMDQWRLEQILKKVAETTLNSEMTATQRVRQIELLTAKFKPKEKDAPPGEPT